MLAVGKPPSLMRRYALDITVLAATAAFLAVTGALGLWLVHSG